MELTDQQTILNKWAKLIALTNAYQRAVEAGEWVQRPNTGGWHRKYTPEQACEIQHLDQQRKALRATMAPRVVSG